eukprot:5827841-Amphidinium_carterae.3
METSLMGCPAPIKQVSYSSYREFMDRALSGDGERFPTWAKSAPIFWMCWWERQTLVPAHPLKLICYLPMYGVLGIRS